MRCAFIILPLFALGLALSIACVAKASDEPDGDGTPGSQTAPGSQSSSQVVDCGIEERRLGSDRNLPSRDCLMRAYNAGQAVTWTTRLPTIEGDPIEFRLNAISKDRIEVLVDNTADKFAAPQDRAVRTYVCTGLAVDPTALPPALRLSGCPEGAAGEVRL